MVHVSHVSRKGVSGAYACVCLCACFHVWRLENEFWFLPFPLFIIVFETGSLTEMGAH